MNDNDQTQHLRDRLVDHLKANGSLTDIRVEAAFRAVPRHLFLPDTPLETVYSDQAIITKLENDLPISSSSQPAIMAIMLEQLDLHPGQRVLEIGAGTGYNAALMGHLVGPTRQVITLDIDDDLVQAARGHLLAAGVDNVQAVCMDGALGYPDAAPYDRIILTVGAWDIAPAWWDQLGSAGRLVLPLALRVNQLSLAFEREADYLTSVSVRECGFMRLRGRMAGPESQLTLGDEPGLSLMVEDSGQVNAVHVYAMLMEPGADTLLPSEISLKSVWGGLGLWLALREPGFCHLTVHSGWLEKAPVPPLFLWRGQWASQANIGVLTAEGICLLARQPAEGDNEQPAQTTLMLRSFGEDVALTERVLAHFAAWDAAGRPGSAGLRIRALPRAMPYTPRPGEAVIDKHWTRLIVDWP